MSDTERGAIEFPHADVIDTRDLHDLLNQLVSARDEHDDPDHDTDECPACIPEIGALLEQLLELEGNIPDWPYGETLISDHYFEDYARELAEDIGAIDDDARWPACHIDWPAAARALRMDYSAYEVDGVTYWAR